VARIAGERPGGFKGQFLGTCRRRESQCGRHVERDSAQPSRRGSSSLLAETGRSETTDRANRPRGEILAGKEDWSLPVLPADLPVPLLMCLELQVSNKSNWRCEPAARFQVNPNSGPEPSARRLPS
jgi:hypothetical protein